ncbi:MULTISPECIES: aspartate/glutamate racemase family protein [Rodentibacter]|uniref:aspartate/glutamate racemase family protein n=1 Tax=Rodentibacter TaxID=1960084 RepID=UPI001CFDA1BF|nr:aspartate/glutamate racemase family protein [Rodentibacter sp. JRC1]GJI55684.1 racemase [Rodentibacter sp. JRC1]
MKTLGIIGGMSPESTATYYTEINRLVNQRKGSNTSAPIVMVSVEFEEIVRYQKRGEWKKAGEILAEAAKRLEVVGAQGIVLATNTMHKVATQIQQAISIPFLHILDATANAIKARNIRKVALLGTKFTMSDNFYRDGLIQRGIVPIVPNEEIQNEIHRIIFDELCVGKFLSQSNAFYLDTIETLQKQGAEGVILGCTEIGLLVNQSDSPLPFFDTAKLHSQMAAEFVVN